MAGIKKAKPAKEAKGPKKAIKEKPSREIKKLAKAAKKADRVLKKRIDRKLGLAAVLLCLLVSVLDVVNDRMDYKLEQIKKGKLGK